jgi:hypothetical protein
VDDKPLGEGRTLQQTVQKTHQAKPTFWFVPVERGEDADPQWIIAADRAGKLVTRQFIPQAAALEAEARLTAQVHRFGRGQRGQQLSEGRPGRAVADWFSRSLGHARRWRRRIGQRAGILEARREVGGVQPGANAS